MTRWIAFDPETTSLLRSNLLHSNLAQGAKVETLRRGPVDYALARAGAVITVLPAPENDGLGIAVFRPSRHLATHPSVAARPAVATQPVSAPPPSAPVAPPVSVKYPAPELPARVAQPANAIPPVPTASAGRTSAGRVGTRASGFLGLSDEVFEEEEVVEEKKGWWKRLWEE
jgi:hypothetical protein